LKLADGSHVEVRKNSELSLERSTHGVRMHIQRGDVIVTVAEPSSERLSVETRDISAVGRVFVVNAKEEGSRVGVIDGEARVRQGKAETRLLPGEQVTTNPEMPLVSVHDEIAWSGQAERHIALLQQSISAGTPVPPSAAPETFEVVSIRKRPQAGGGSRGGDSLNGQIPTCYGSLGGTDPSRFRASKISAYHLMMMSLGKDCVNENSANANDLILREGPEWVWTDQYDIEAVIPAGQAAFSLNALAPDSVMAGCKSVTAACRLSPGPRLQAMLKALLAERFKLVLRTETREAPVYFLTVASGGAKLTEYKTGERMGAPMGYRYEPDLAGTQMIGRLRGRKASMAQLAETVRLLVGRHVLDRTGIAGEFTFEISFAPDADIRQQLAQVSSLPIMTSPSFRTALEEGLGLKLDSGRAPVEFLTIERIEKPSEN
jgi:uncharacterized protein (TIGR03435 family)